MSEDRICGALGCRNDADGIARKDGREIHTCLDCADKNDLKVTLYE